MFDFFLELDKVLFLLFNSLLANPFLDPFWKFITDDNYLRLIFLLILVLLLIFGDRKQRWLVLFAGITMVLTDQTSAGLLKPLFERARPCHLFSADEINLLVGCGSGFSMPSAHAANVFGQAVLISAHVRFTKWPLYIYAVLVAASRVFVGVHYPADIIVGALVGIIAGKIMSRFFVVFHKKVLTPPDSDKNQSDPPIDQQEESTDAG